MSDLEMTKLCADAVDLQWRDPGSPRALAHPESALQCLDENEDGCVWRVYDPLHSDEQAMALLLWLKPASFHYNVYAGKWSIHTLRDNETGAAFEAFDADPRRAIVECVAKMAASKVEPQDSSQAK